MFMLLSFDVGWGSFEIGEFGLINAVVKLSDVILLICTKLKFMKSIKEYYQNTFMKMIVLCLVLLFSTCRNDKIDEEIQNDNRDSHKVYFEFYEEDLEGFDFSQLSMILSTDSVKVGNDGSFEVADIENFNHPIIGLNQKGKVLFAYKLLENSEEYVLSVYDFLNFLLKSHPDISRVFANMDQSKINLQFWLSDKYDLLYEMYLNELSNNQTVLDNEDFISLLNEVVAETVENNYFEIYEDQLKSSGASLNINLARDGKITYPSQSIESKVFCDIAIGVVNDKNVLIAGPEIISRYNYGTLELILDEILGAESDKKMLQIPALDGKYYLELSNGMYYSVSSDISGYAYERNIYMLAFMFASIVIPLDIGNYEEINKCYKEAMPYYYSLGTKILQTYQLKGEEGLKELFFSEYNSLFTTIVTCHPPKKHTFFKTFAHILKKIASPDAYANYFLLLKDMLTPIGHNQSFYMSDGITHGELFFEVFSNDTLFVEEGIDDVYRVGRLEEKTIEYKIEKPFLTELVPYETYSTVTGIPISTEVISGDLSIIEKPYFSYGILDIYYTGGAEQSNISINFFNPVNLYISYEDTSSVLNHVVPTRTVSNKSPVITDIYVNREARDETSEDVWIYVYWTDEDGDTGSNNYDQTGSKIDNYVEYRSCYDQPHPVSGRYCFYTTNESQYEVLHYNDGYSGAFKFSVGTGPKGYNHGQSTYVYLIDKSGNVSDNSKYLNF